MLFMRRLMGVVVFLMLSAAAFAASPLEETQWRVEVTQKGETIPRYVDRLRFQEGQFTSVIFSRKGFPTSPYTLTRKAGGTVVWEAKQKSDTEGTLVWHAELDGEALKGTLVWTQANGKVIENSLTGGAVVEEPETVPAAGTTPGSKAPASKRVFGCSLIVSP